MSILQITHNMAPTNNTPQNWDDPEYMKIMYEFDKNYPWSYNLADLLGEADLTDDEIRIFEEKLDRMRKLEKWSSEEQLDSMGELEKWDQNNAKEEYHVNFDNVEWQPRRWYPNRKDRNTKYHPTTNKTPTKANLSVKRNIKKHDVKGQRRKFKKDCARDQKEYLDQYNLCDCDMCGPGPLLCHSCRNDTLMMVKQEMRDRFSHIEFHFSVWDGLETEKDILDRMFQIVWLTDVLVDITAKSESVQVSFYNDGQDDRDEEDQDEFQKENWHLKCGRKDSHTKLTRKDRRVRRKNGYRGMTHAGRRRNASKLATSI